MTHLNMHLMHEAGARLLIALSPGRLHSIVLSHAALAPCRTASPGTPRQTPSAGLGHQSTQASMLARPGSAKQRVGAWPIKSAVCSVYGTLLSSETGTPGSTPSAGLRTRAR